jgi:hypothetical protein
MNAQHAEAKFDFPAFSNEKCELTREFDFARMNRACCCAAHFPCWTQWPNIPLPL